MTSEIICNVSDAGVSFRSSLEARSRIRVGDKKVIIPVDLQQNRLSDRERKAAGAFFD
jgi:hypothetical protein